MFSVSLASPKRRGWNPRTPARASALRTAFGWGIPTILTRRDAASPWTMVAAETCGHTLRRPAAGCWVSGLYQKINTARAARTHFPTACRTPVPTIQLGQTTPIFYIVLLYKSMGSEKFQRCRGAWGGFEVQRLMFDV